MELIGLATCDTCRAARRALLAAGHNVTFRDLRRDPLPEREIAALRDAHGDDLVNRRSTTWRSLGEAERALNPADLLSRHPALMKRPVIRQGDRSWLGWGPEVQAALGAC